MTDIHSWMQAYEELVCGLFGGRVRFIGLQGSYARKEAHADSDIDVVLILDTVSAEDLKTYKKGIQTLPCTGKICGFVSGAAELKGWCKSELFQFYYDTVPVRGKLEEMILPPSAEDARRAALNGACAIYHGCSHNFLHGESADMLKSLYKSAFFVLQAKFFCQTGIYLHSRKELAQKVSGADGEILQISCERKKIVFEDLAKYTELLLGWSASVIEIFSKPCAKTQTGRFENEIL